jgi:hypothetical protein
MNWTPDFHFLIVVTPLAQECTRGESEEMEAG